MKIPEMRPAYLMQYFMEMINLKPYLTLLVLILTIKLFSILIIRMVNPSSSSSSPVYLLDFTCYKPGKGSTQCRHFSHKAAMERARGVGTHSEKALAFMEKMLERTGLGDKTYAPAALISGDTSLATLEAARQESREVIFSLVEDLLERTKVAAADIGILIVNCCVFNVVPSLSSMVVNRFKLRDDIRSFNISGMGCSAGLRCVGLAKNLLKVHNNTVALVVSTETLTQNWYFGNDESMLLSNCLFRAGGAAILLTNRPADNPRVKYELIHSVDTHNAFIDRSYNCIFLDQDEDGYLGITINKDLIVSAMKAIRSNVSLLARLVLPAHVKLIYFVNFAMRRYLRLPVKRYAPKIGDQFDHFLPHLGGKFVLDALEENLGFSKAQMEPARMTLYRFGNTSSSTIWYELAYSEAKGRIKKNDRLWQLSMGSGFKSSSVVWKAVRSVDPEMRRSPWTDEIDEFPVDLSHIGSSIFHFESK